MIIDYDANDDNEHDDDTMTMTIIITVPYVGGWVGGRSALTTSDLRLQSQIVSHHLHHLDHRLLIRIMTILMIIIIKTISQKEGVRN